jgi:diguanylate cyclase (GGDEF)-like protein/PAS domain S-box-containing protein
VPASLTDSEELYRDLFDNAPVGYHEVDAGGRLVRVNRTELTMLGYEAHEMIGRFAWEFVVEAISREAFAAKIAGTLPLAPFERTFRRKDGSELPVMLEERLLHDAGGNTCGIRTTVFDITERKAMERALRDSEERYRSLAYHDPLTGLPNRILFNDRLTMAAAQANRQKQRVGVLFIDLDRFKTINDSLGHSIGDELLKAVACRIQSCLREGDTVSRLGGDEFTLVLPGLGDAVDAARVAEKVLIGLRAPFRLEGCELRVSASIGISLYPDDGLDVDGLLRNADVAMYRAKDQGRDGYQVYAAAPVRRESDRPSFIG